MTVPARLSWIVAVLALIGLLVWWWGASSQVGGGLSPLGGTAAGAEPRGDRVLTELSEAKGEGRAAEFALVENGGEVDSAPDEAHGEVNGAVLEPTHELLVRVMNLSDQPIPGALVVVRRGGISLERSADLNGVALFSEFQPQVQRPGSVGIQVSAPGYALRSLFAGGEEWGEEGSVVEVVARMLPGGGVRAVVRDQDGELCASAVVLAYRKREGGNAPEPGVSGHRRLVTDAEGVVEIRGLTPGEWSFQAVAWRIWFDGEKVTVDVPPGESVEVELDVVARDRGSYVSGFVLPGDGAYEGDGSESLASVRSDRRCFFRRVGGAAGTHGVFSDGFSAFELEEGDEGAWRLLSFPDERVLAEVELVAGGHGLRIEVDY